jgi:hypothetical protein
VAWDGAHFLVVWTDSRDGTGNSDIYGARVAPDGTILDGTGIPISTAPGPQFGPAVSWGGGRFLVAWTDGRTTDVYPDVYGTLVSTGGSVSSPAGIALSTVGLIETAVSVASNGSTFLVAWQDGVDEGDERVFGVRVSATGTVLGRLAIASAATTGTYEPSLASDGTDYLAVWWSGSQIYGRRISGAGAILDATPIPITNVSGSRRHPAAAWGGSNYLVAWSESPIDTVDVHGARVSAAGVVLDRSAIPISTGAAQDARPSVAWQGSFLVAWQRRRSDGSYDVYGQRVGGDGALLDPSAFPVAASASDETHPAVANGPGDHVGIAYSRFVEDAPYGAIRAFLRTSPK